MNKPIRLGILGLTHDHVWGNLEVLADFEDAKLVAVSDPNQPLLDKVKEQWACTTYLDHEELLDEEELDAVFICSDNATGADLTIRAAQHDLHVMVEKPMAATLDGAERMLAAAQKAGVRLMINWPVVWRPQVQAAIDLATRPEFGEIWQITHRAGHGGIYVECTPYFREWIVKKELNGAGALIDVCSYGVNLAQILLGHPQRVTAVTGNLVERELAVEDNAIIVMSYPGAMATAEGAWGQKGVSFTGYLATIWGTNGSVIVGPGRGGKLWMTTADNPECIEVEPPQPEPHMANGIAHFIWAIATGEEFFPLCRAAICRNTQEVLEAAIISAQSRKEVTLPLSTER
ncbi:MAG: Gfo/Idh/MocA family oxidoreductase [Pirellulales bacterium]|nr:Gfo/Idh/MocA family oxidoreductase [Pirellulales bacterium]